MIRDPELDFGVTLHTVVIHLVKNAHKIPEPVVKAAQGFEDASWAKQDPATKRTRLLEVAKHTEEPSPIHRHFESYPHAFSKEQYAAYLGALKRYKDSLGIP